MKITIPDNERWYHNGDIALQYLLKITIPDKERWYHNGDIALGYQISKGDVVSIPDIAKSDKNARYINIRIKDQYQI